jgi:hypothetical protein
MKIGTKTDTRSRRNGLGRVDRTQPRRHRTLQSEVHRTHRYSHCSSPLRRYEHRKLHSSMHRTHRYSHYSPSRQQITDDRTLHRVNDRTLKQPRPIVSREVSEWRKCDWMCPVACAGRKAASDQHVHAPTVGRTGRVRSRPPARPVRGRNACFDSNG